MQKKTKTLFFSLIGNLSENYDYALFGFLVNEINHHFFPATTEDKFLALVKVYGLFAISHLFRPLGAIIFSRIGDKHGRKTSLMLSMAGISLGTFMMGLTPSYEDIGAWSMFILIIARFLQGICYSSEVDGVMIFSMEHLKKKQYCFSSGLCGLSDSMGVFLASALAGQLIDKSNYWQYLYIFGGSLSLFILLVRSQLVESPAFLEEKKKNEPKIPTLKVLKENARYVGIYALLKGTGSGMYYFFSVFIVGFLADSTGTITQKEVAVLVTAFVFGCGFSSALIGYLSDKMSDKARLFMNMGLFFTLHSAFLVCVYYKTFPWALFVLIGAAARANIIPIMPLLFNSLKVKSRFRVFAIGRSIGSVLIAGATPLVCSAIYLNTQNKYLTLGYPLVLMALYSATYFYALKTRKIVSEDPEDDPRSPLCTDNTCESVS